MCVVENFFHFSCLARYTKQTEVAYDQCQNLLSISWLPEQFVNTSSAPPTRVEYSFTFTLLHKRKFLYLIYIFLCQIGFERFQRIRKLYKRELWHNLVVHIYKKPLANISYFSNGKVVEKLIIILFRWASIYINILRSNTISFQYRCDNSLV